MFTDLINRASQIKADDIEDQGPKLKSEEQPKPALSKAPGPSQAQSNDSEEYVPRCYYSPGRHLQKDCPVLADRRRGQPQENWRRVTDQDSPMPSTSTNQQYPPPEYPGTIRLCRFRQLREY